MTFANFGVERPVRGSEKKLPDWLLPGIGDALPASAHAHRTVPEIVAAVCHDRPTDVAVLSGGYKLTYRQVGTWACHVAAEVTAAGAGAGDRVAIMAEPSLAMVAAALGVMTSGAAYVPIDLSHPDARIDQILMDAKVTAIVVTESASGRLAGSRYPVVRVGGWTDPVSSEPLTGPLPAPRPPDPAYLIYTSGSTGEPKGVLVEHAQLTASTLARHLAYPGRSTFLLLSSLAFDSSVAGLWGTLTSGGRLVVASADDLRAAGRLVELIETHRVTRMLCVPSLYGVLLDAAERLGTDRLRSLETVIVAGEALPDAIVARHFATLPRSVALVNEYGPTEATVWASYHKFTGPEPVSIGRPIPGARLYVLDDQRSPVPTGISGELYIGGSYVARGYFGRPDATAVSFTGDPFSGLPGTRMYRTGDIVRWNESGTLEFLGRRDDQVKIRGHRLEPGAIEVVLRALPGVSDAVVLPNADKTGLVAFVVAAGVSATSIRQRASHVLPPVMIPAEIRLIDIFPRTGNGKVDRAALRRAAAESAPSLGTVSGPAFAAGDGITARVAAAWAEVLNTVDIPTDVNFFDLGGHSLSVFKLQDALDRHTGVRPSIVALFADTTVAAQAALLSGDGGGAGRAAPDGQMREHRTLAAGVRRRRLSQETS